MATGRATIATMHRHRDIAPSRATRGATREISVHVLGSGSAGNAIAISGGSTTLLLDCGFSARETLRRLALCGVDSATITGIVVSHEHTDHIRGVRVLANRIGVPVWASLGTRRAAAAEALGSDVRRIRAGERIVIGDLTLTAFRGSHDAAEPLGFRFDGPSGSFGVLTDTGEVTAEAYATLAGCTLLGIESNHCVRMLAEGPYPAFLKRRIASAHGHLSNDAAAEAIERLASDALRSVVALHLSSTNNTSARAAESIVRRLGRLSHPATVRTAPQGEICAL